MTTSDILLSPGPDAGQTKITQLYQYLELLTEGDPPRQSLFILAPKSDPFLSGEEITQESIDEERKDQLLIVDPPPDITQRFKLDAEVAVLFTGDPEPNSLPLMQTQPGGVAHLRVGDHYIDLYSQAHSNLLLLPAVGVLCTGGFGSDVTVPAIGEGSDGAEELETLRLLARLVRQRIQLLIPRTGTTCNAQFDMMERLAGDVAYLHSLQRVMKPLAQRQAPQSEVMQLAETLLPQARQSPTAWAVHRANLSRLSATLNPETNQKS